MALQISPKLLLHQKKSLFVKPLLYTLRSAGHCKRLPVICEMFGVTTAVPLTLQCFPRENRLQDGQFQEAGSSWNGLGWTQNHLRDRKDHLFPTPLPRIGTLPSRPALAQSPIQPSLKYCQGLNTHSFSRQQQEEG